MVLQYPKNAFSCKKIVLNIYLTNNQMNNQMNELYNNFWIF